MKRRIIGLIICLLIIVGLGTIYKISYFQKDNDYKTINLAEVTHSPFYAPLYIAIENNYFKEQGLDVNLILTSGADKVSAAVLSNDVEIGFAGAESAIYVFNGGEKDYLQIFSSLTKRDGQFIVSKTKQENFSLNDLIGKEILVGRKGGMPAINFLNALKNENIDPKEIKLNYSVEFAALSGAFIGGNGDYVNLFEPNATLLESEQLGYSVASIGLLSGEVPYTTFYSRKSYIDNNQKTIDEFTKAIDKALKFTQDNDSLTIAKIILPQFPNISLNDLEQIIDRYKNADSWFANTCVSEKSFKNLEDMMIDNDLLNKYVSYNDLVRNKCNE